MQFSDLTSYQFTLPKELLRTKGVEPRDSARLFVYDTKTNTVTHAIFRDLPKFLPKDTLLIFNETRVLPARLILHKKTGGKVEIFVLMNEWQGDVNHVPFKTNRKLLPQEELLHNDRPVLQVESKEGQIFYGSFLPQDTALEEFLEENGQTPIPPYLKANDETETRRRERYQTVFAKQGASVAAPTASLHFTDKLLQKLEEKGVEKATLSLEVGLGTFAPLSDENFTSKKLHTEYVTFTDSFLNKLQESRKSNTTIIPVGTTALRALETALQKDITYACTVPTDIFIYPGVPIQGAGGLITNFHTPGSSLMLLVDALLQQKMAKRGIMSLYEEAIKEKYSFYSFGDSMLIL
jgi:S-adenosylmethionine:tRNA ribosyltransferase-isomerase